MRITLEREALEQFLNDCDAIWNAEAVFAILDYVDAHAEPETPTWQPIETAPKDGTSFLVARLGEEIGCRAIEITEWCVIEQSHFEEIGDGLYRKVIDQPYEFWNNNGHRGTHWMPCPPAPPVADPLPEESR